MQPIVCEEPYRFIPPHRGRFWTTVLRPFLRPWLRTFYGVTGIECRGIELLKESLSAGHGILLAVNHCRPADPIALGEVVIKSGCPQYAMASWHIFRETWLQSKLLPRVGAFSVYREGVDRQALNTAIGALENPDRPLVIFPEGAITRCNDQLYDLLDGTAFVARTAAKRRAKAGAGKVVIHPMLMKYLFKGDIHETVRPALEMIEGRLSWQTQDDLPLLERVGKVCNGVLALKEIEHMGRPSEGPVYERVARLIEHLLGPLEDEWTGGKAEGNVINRAKNIRTAILPDMVAKRCDDAERRRRWRQIEHAYLAQQLSLYPSGYLEQNPTPERILETVERLEEDLYDKVRVYSPQHLVIQVCPPIEVGPERIRGGDPLMDELAVRMQRALDELAKESGDPLPVPESWAHAEAAAVG